jgi:hypothetical protein
MPNDNVVLTADSRAERSRDPLPTFNALDFIANLLYQADCAKHNSNGVRWWCHGARGSRRRWRKKAREAIEQWAADEQATMNSRNKSPLEFFR